MTALPQRDSPKWKEAQSAVSLKPFLVRAMPRKSGTLIDKIYSNTTFWIIPAVTETADSLTWVAVKTLTVVGWCASPPLTYTFAVPELPPDDDDTQPLPPYQELPPIPEWLISDTSERGRIAGWLRWLADVIEHFPAVRL